MSSYSTINDHVVGSKRTTICPWTASEALGSVVTPNHACMILHVASILRAACMLLYGKCSQQDASG